MSRPAPETASILAGAAAALGASSCCVLPLALVTLGIGSAWLARLRALEPLYPGFVGLAIAAFAFAFWRLYLRPVSCGTGDACADPAVRRRQRTAFWITLVAAHTLILFPFAYARWAA
jgi:mercuric ion transport protein